jgi:transcriptional regulator of arginine metabolism
VKPMSKDVEREQRREAIRSIIRKQRIATQDELRVELRKRGFEVTQATLSRDLTKLNARRPAGRALGYEFADAPAVPEASELSSAADMVVSVAESHALVVVQTRTGAASIVAAVLDRVRLPEVLGTIAGDDTIFLAPDKRIKVAALAKRLRSIWKKGQ